MEIIYQAFFIMALRICDVSLGTIRTLMTVQSRKYIAGIIGFIEVIIWLFAIRHVMMHLDNFYNIFGYAAGFALGTICGITLEKIFGPGYVTMHVFSINYADKIAQALRENKVGVTLLPGEGASGGVAIIYALIPRKRQREITKIIDGIDSRAFVSINSSIFHKGGYTPLRK